MLGYALGVHEDELRADLQQFYNIDLDHAMDGAHSASHCAALVAPLPAGARLRVSEDADERWTLDASMLAAILNSLNSLIYMFGAKKGDKRPPLVGPSWMTSRSGERKVDAMVMTIDQLKAELAKPRRAVER